MENERRKLQVKFYNKRVNSKAEGIDFKLTFEQFIELAKQAGITSNDMHIRGYHLARYNDEGCYEIGKCRFITYLENYTEKKISDKNRASARNNMIIFNNSLSAEDRKVLQKKAAKALAQKFKNLTKEQKILFTGALNDAEIQRRHKLLKTVMKGNGFLKRASVVLNITPQAIGRFLKKYPMA